MKTANFDGTTLTLIKTNESSDYLSTHLFEVKWSDGESDEVGIRYPEQADEVGKWLVDNCDIENTAENIKLLKSIIK